MVSDTMSRDWLNIVPVENFQGSRRTQNYKGKLATGAEQQGTFQGSGVIDFELAGQKIGDRRFRDNKCRCDCENPDGRFNKSVEVNAKAHEQEESPEQQALKRFNNGLNGAAVFGFRKGQSGNEGTKGHGEASEICQHAGANGNQKHSRHEQIRAIRSSHKAKQWLKGKTAHTYDQGNGKGSLDKGGDDALQNRPGAFLTQYTNEDQDGDYGQVLKQEDGKTCSAGLGAQPFFIGIELDDNGCGRQGKGGSKYSCLGGSKAKAIGKQGDH